MTKSLRIRISVADRVYPMTIKPDQEEGLRKAAKKIETIIKQLEKNYAVRDKQDVLAMCALQFAAQAEQHVISDREQIKKAEDKLDQLDRLLQKNL